MTIADQGSIVLFIARSDEELKWLQENTDAESWQWMGRSLVVDHRLAEDLIQGVRDAGFPIK